MHLVSVLSNVIQLIHLRLAFYSALLAINAQQKMATVIITIAISILFFDLLEIWILSQVTICSPFRFRDWHQ